MTMTSSVNAALQDITITTKDRAVVELARRYARHIDRSPDDLAKIGPALLSCLEALGLTPRARRNVTGANDAHRSPLDELRQRRERRAE